MAIFRQSFWWLKDVLALQIELESKVTSWRAPGAGDSILARLIDQVD